MMTKFWLLFVLAFAYIQSYALRTINAILAPELRQSFALSDSQLGLLTSAYFISFCLMQIPLGIWLDRFGTRRVESLLMLAAAIGTLIFATTSTFENLLIGRLLIGLGVSACLMGAFKIFREHFPLEKQGTLSIFMLFFGSTGALLSTQPAHFVVEQFGWQSLFYGMTASLVLAAFLLWWRLPNPVPHPPPPSSANSSGDISNTKEALQGSYKAIFMAPIFWQSIPNYFVMVGGYLALQSLWCGPWLIEVAGYTRNESANVLFKMALVQLVSFMFIGFFVAPWAARKHKEIWVVKVSFIFAILSLLAAILDPKNFALYGFLGFAFFFSTNTFSMTLLNAYFPNKLVGRSSTTSNFLIFIGAFFFQWSFGAYSDFWINQGLTRAEALNRSMTIMVVLMFIAWMWYAFSARRAAPAIAHYFAQRLSNTSPRT